MIKKKPVTILVKYEGFIQRITEDFIYARVKKLKPSIVEYYITVEKDCFSVKDKKQLQEGSVFILTVGFIGKDKKGPSFVKAELKRIKNPKI